MNATYTIIAFIHSIKLPVQFQEHVPINLHSEMTGEQLPCVKNCSTDNVFILKNVNVISIKHLALFSTNVPTKIQPEIKSPTSNIAANWTQLNACPIKRITASSWVKNMNQSPKNLFLALINYSSSKNLKLFKTVFN